MIATSALLGRSGGWNWRSDYFFTDERRRFTWTSSRAKSTKCVRELVLPEDAEAATTFVTLILCATT